jgi:hypothetical protein
MKTYTFFILAFIFGQSKIYGQISNEQVYFHYAGIHSDYNLHSNNIHVFKCWQTTNIDSTHKKLVIVCKRDFAGRLIDSIVGKDILSELYTDKFHYEYYANNTLKKIDYTFWDNPLSRYFVHSALSTAIFLKIIPNNADTSIVKERITPINQKYNYHYTNNHIDIYHEINGLKIDTFMLCNKTISNAIQDTIRMYTVLIGYDGSWNKKNLFESTKVDSIENQFGQKIYTLSDKTYKNKLYTITAASDNKIIEYTDEIDHTTAFIIYTYGYYSTQNETISTISYYGQNYIGKQSKEFGKEKNRLKNEYVKYIYDKKDNLKQIINGNEYTEEYGFIGTKQFFNEKKQVIRAISRDYDMEKNIPILHEYQYKYDEKGRLVEKKGYINGAWSITNTYEYE